MIRETSTGECQGAIDFRYNRDFKSEESEESSEFGESECLEGRTNRRDQRYSCYSLRTSAAGSIRLTRAAAARSTASPSLDSSVIFTR